MSDLEDVYNLSCELRKKLMLCYFKGLSNASSNRFDSMLSNIQKWALMNLDSEKRIDEVNEKDKTTQ